MLQNDGHDWWGLECLSGGPGRRVWCCLGERAGVTQPSQIGAVWGGLQSTNIRVLCGNRSWTMARVSMHTAPPASHHQNTLSMFAQAACGCRIRGRGRDVPRDAAPLPGPGRRRQLRHKCPQVAAHQLRLQLLWVRDSTHLKAALSITPVFLRAKANILDYKVGALLCGVPVCRVQN